MAVASNSFYSSTGHLDDPKRISHEDFMIKSSYSLPQSSIQDNRQETSFIRQVMGSCFSYSYFMRVFMRVLMRVFITKHEVSIVMGLRLRSRLGLRLKQLGGGRVVRAKIRLSCELSDGTTPNLGLSFIQDKKLLHSFLL